MIQISNKCFYDDCCKRLKLTDLKCRCENIYCLTHRLPESHKCNYNYKQNSTEKKQIIEYMKCVNDKCIKI